LSHQVHNPVADGTNTEGEVSDMVAQRKYEDTTATALQERQGHLEPETAPLLLFERPRYHRFVLKKFWPPTEEVTTTAGLTWPDNTTLNVNLNLASTGLTSMLPGHGMITAGALEELDAPGGAGTYLFWWGSGDVFARRVLGASQSGGIPSHFLLAAFDYPPNFAEISAAMEQSRTLLEWEEDWDGDAARRFEPFTWERAREFVLDNTIRLWRTAHAQVPVPQIEPTRRGGINIEWETALRNLLVNIPADGAEPVTFYGTLKNDPDHEHDIEGTVDVVGDNTWLLMWIGQA
jgi:hypothetical protein